MKHKETKIEFEDNHTSESHVKAILLLFAGGLGSLLLFYIISGFVVGLFVDSLSLENEQLLTGFLSKKQVSKIIFKKTQSAKALRWQSLLDSLVAKSKLKHKKFNLYIVSGSDRNAFAEAGNNIRIIAPLIDNAKSENEVALVLGHELGHFYHRHHLKALGRSILFFGISVLFLGTDSAITEIAKNTLSVVDLSFSREQEESSDMFGLDLLNTYYGHVNGSLGFYEYMEENASGLKSLLYYGATHPHPKFRLQRLKDEIAKRGYLTTGELSHRP